MPLQPCSVDFGASSQDEVIRQSKDLLHDNITFTTPCTCLCTTILDQVMRQSKDLCMTTKPFNCLADTYTPTV